MQYLRSGWSPVLWSTHYIRQGLCYGLVQASIRVTEEKAC